MKYKDYNDYEIHPDGSVVSYKYKKPRVLKSGLDGDGYPLVVLHKNGIKRTRTVHRLVAECFVTNPNNLPEVNHKDGNKQNNNASNLEWCTRSENITHAYRTGLKTSTKGRKYKKV